MAANHQRDRKSPSQLHPGIPATTHGSSQSVHPLKNKKTAHVAPLQSSTLVPFQSTMLQTKHSTWTPVLHKPSNEQLYVERRDLIGHWFDMWTDLQRKRFLRYILGRCKRNQINFLHKFFNDNIPVTHADFTKYIPRFLSLYIFSFLDPRSLSRAGMVCWHWKFLTEQDTLWMPKCIRQGWFLPYTPKVNEYGSWKFHYIKCLQSLDVAHPSDKNLKPNGCPLQEREEIFESHIGVLDFLSPGGDVDLALSSRVVICETELYGRQSDGSRYLSEEELEKKRRALELKNADKKATMVWRERPPWLDPDPKPGDLIQSQNLLIASANPKIDPTRVRGHLRSFTEPSGRHIEYGLYASGRKQHHRSTTEGEQMLGTDQKKLSSVVAEEAFEDRGDAVEQPWSSPQRNTSVYRRKDLSGGGGDYTILRSSGTFSPSAGTKIQPSAQDIRLVIISSNVPAYEILYASVKPYVMCLCYDYDSITMEALQEQVEGALTGIRAKSVAIITRGLDEVNLVKNVGLSNKSLEKPELKQFFEVLTTLMVTASEGAHLDIFAPLAATERGSALETDLSRLTGVQVTSPDVIGNDPFMHVCSGVWSSNPEKDVLPPFLYFEENKLRLWQVEALRSQEAIRLCRENMERFYKNKMGSRLSRVTGEAVLESLQEEKEDFADKLIPALKKAVEALSEEEKESVDPVEFVSEYLANLTGKLLSSTIKSADKMSRGQKEMKSNLWEKDIKSETQEARLSETNSVAEEIEEESIADDLELGSDFGQSEKLMKFSTANPHKPMRTASVKSHELGTFDERKMDEEILEPMDRKSSFIQIVSSEKDFVNVLDILHDVFMKKLQSALNSNKAITSLPNIDLIFSDANVLRSVHRPFLEELESRLTEWNSQQCVGDCFIKLQSKLKAYTNFHNNYPVILSTIDKCREQEPSFRAFLKRHNRTPDTRMSTLQELFLMLSCRIQDYIRLLIHQEHCTPVDHADRADLSAAIRTFQDLQERIDQNRRRGETERSLKLLQKKILGCPNLLEANRHLIREEHVAQLRQEPINISIVPFQQIQNLCLFLFNDALMVTVETKRHIPYTREVCSIFKFQAAASLTKLRVEDVPDSRYASNVFLMKTPKRQWLCSLPTYSTKLSWVTILEETIHAAMDVD